MNRERMKGILANLCLEMIDEGIMENKGDFKVLNAFDEVTRITRKVNK